MSMSLVLYVPPDVHPEKVTVRVGGTQENPTFVLADLCRVLGNANPSQVAARLDADEKGIHIVDGNGQPGSQMIVVNEAGLYHTIMTSRADNAATFRRWVCHTVLPSIRKHGCYPPPAIIPKKSRAAMVLEMAQALYEQEERLEAIENQQEQQQEAISEAKHIAQTALDAHTSNHGHFTVLGYFKFTKRGSLSLSDASKHGKKLTAICQGLGIPLHTTPDPRFGTVNTYPESVLSDYFGPN